MRPCHVSFLIGLALLGGCRSTPGRVILPGGPRPPEVWSPDELERPLAAHPRLEGEASRFVLARLNSPEEPHVHDTDVTVFVLRGSGRIHYGAESHAFRAGDVIELPAGLEHWAEPTGESVEAYLVFTAPIAR